MPNIVIGTVEASGSSNIRYYIGNKDAQKSFRIDERMGKITVTKELDGDGANFVLLNLEVEMGVSAW